MNQTNHSRHLGWLYSFAVMIVFLGGCASGPFNNGLFRFPSNETAPPPSVLGPNGTLNTSGQINAHEIGSDGTAPDIMIDTTDLDESN